MGGSIPSVTGYKISACDSHCVDRTSTSERKGYSAQKCAAACTSDSKCKGFSWNTADTRSGNRYCIKCWKVAARRDRGENWVTYKKGDQCAPTTIEGCRLAAQQHGLKLGIRIGYYSYSGCYAYNQGSYKGQAFFGTKGTEKKMQDPVPHAGLGRVERSCKKLEKQCAPTTIEGCRLAAQQHGLKLG